MFNAVREMQKIQIALDEVKPVVGSVPVQYNSAGVYRAALKQLGYDVRGLADEAMVSIWRHGRHGRSATGAMAMDSKTNAEYETMFPNANRLQRR